MSDEVQPTVVRGIPYCAREKCVSFDGKRCRVMGFQPHAICEPAVDEMQAALSAERDTSRRLREALADRLRRDRDAIGSHLRALTSPRATPGATKP